MRERGRQRDYANLAREQVAWLVQALVQHGERVFAQASAVILPAVSHFAVAVTEHSHTALSRVANLAGRARRVSRDDLTRWFHTLSSEVTGHARTIRPDELARRLRALGQRAFAERSYVSSAIRLLEIARARVSLAMLLCVCAVLLPGALLSGSSVAQSAPFVRRAPVIEMAPPPSSFNTAIQHENTRLGTTDWFVPESRDAGNEIQAYASAPSVSAGGTLSFYVSVQYAGAPYQIDLYRLGWYGGAGGRLMLHMQATGQAQGYWDETKGMLVGCGSCVVDRKTGLAEANWKPSFELSIPHDWMTGVYLATFTVADGKATTVTFDVRGDMYSTYVMVTTDTTVQAYSDWGGASLYLARYKLPNARGSKVSFDRPVAGWGTAQGLLYEIDGIRWLEKNGYDVSYISSVDLDEHPEQLLGHRAMLDFGHDEYWSKAMRDGVQRARDAGIGLGFIGANIDYWQIRFGPDSHGVADRTIICYKSAASDPYIKGDQSQLTVESRNSLVGHPENGLMGAMYSDWISPPRAFPWHVSANAPGWLLAGTGLQPGKSYGCDLVGYEWDKTYDNGSAPKNLQVLSDSPVTALDGRRDISNTVYYVASSGALVFDAGSIKWDFALDGFRLAHEDDCGSQEYPVPGMQQLLANVLAALVVRQKP